MFRPVIGDADGSGSHLVGVLFLIDVSGCSRIAEHLQANAGFVGSDDVRVMRSSHVEVDHIRALVVRLARRRMHQWTRLDGQVGRGGR